MPPRTPKPRGRPRKTALDRRAASITVRLRLGEAARLDTMALEAGLTPSEFLRARAFAPSPAPSVPSDLRHDLYRLLLAIQRGLTDGLAPATLARHMQATLDRLHV